MKVKPVALDAIAEVIAENIVGERPATSLDVAGPEIKTLWDMTEKVRRRGIVQVPLLPPGTTWRASRDGRLVPDPKVAEIGHTSPNGLQHEASDIQRTARKRDDHRTRNSVLEEWPIVGIHGFGRVPGWGPAYGRILAVSIGRRAPFRYE